MNKMNNLQLNQLFINYDNKIFVTKDVVCDGNYLYNSLVQSGFIPCSRSSTFRSE